MCVCHVLIKSYLLTYLYCNNALNVKSDPAHNLYRSTGWSWSHSCSVDCCDLDETLFCRFCVHLRRLAILYILFAKENKTKGSKFFTVMDARIVWHGHSNITRIIRTGQIYLPRHMRGLHWDYLVGISQSLLKVCSLSWVLFWLITET